MLIRMNQEYKKLMNKDNSRTSSEKNDLILDESQKKVIAEGSKEAEIAFKVYTEKTSQLIKDISIVK